MNLVKHKKKIIAAVLLACVGYAWSCIAAIPKQAPPMVPERSSWVVYWDWEQGVKKALIQDVHWQNNFVLIYQWMCAHLHIT